jgi:hypothetical protein
MAASSAAVALLPAIARIAVARIAIAFVARRARRLFAVFRKNGRGGKRKEAADCEACG